MQLSFRGQILGIGAAAPGSGSTLGRREGGGQEPGFRFMHQRRNAVCHSSCDRISFFSVSSVWDFLNLITVPLMGLVVASGGAAVFSGLATGNGGRAFCRFAAGGGRLILDWYAWCCRLFERLPGKQPASWTPGLLAAWPVLWSSHCLSLDGKEKKRREKKPGSENPSCRRGISSFPSSGKGADGDLSRCGTGRRNLPSDKTGSDSL